MITKALVDHKNKLIMDWNEKAGCTVLVHMFFEHMGLIDEALSYSKWIHDYRQQVFSKLNVVRYIDLEQLPYFKFKVVRNPYNRVVSSYLTIMRQIKERLPRVYNKNFEKNKLEIKRLLDVEDVDISFRQFVDYLSLVDIRNCDNHYEQQRKAYEDRVKWDKLCKLETIKNDLLEVNKKAGVQLRIADKTSVHHFRKNQNMKMNVSDIKWSNMKDNIPEYIHFYTPDLVYKVAEIYSEDFEAYQYSFENSFKLSS